MATRKGCFVYCVTASDTAIAVRSAPTQEDAYKTSLNARSGNLVSIDCIRQPFKGGPKFLRLADGSGWLFDKSSQGGQIAMEPVPVESGLWCFYVDNNPVGIGVRSHPMDSGSTTGLNHYCQPERTLPPQQKIHCDKKVSDGTRNFYRLQGSSSGWVFDKRGDSHMLIPEHSISFGLTAYQISTENRGGLSMRSCPDVGDESKIPGCSAGEGCLVVGDCLRQSPFIESKNGPFLRLTNGMGWLFEHKYGEKMMKEVFIETGLWYFKVVNSNGIQLRKQPIDDFKYRFPTTYPQGEVLTCDRQIVGANGVKFYQVKGTSGWVFDTRNGKLMMTLCRPPNAQFTPNQYLTNSSQPSWTVDFVRGVACAIEGIHEIDLNEQSRVISFSKEGTTRTRINVYYTTRTIGTALDHPQQGKTQLFRRDCTDAELAEIMRNPRVHTNRGYKRKKPRTSSDQAGSSIDAEEEMRNTLLDVDDALATLEERRRNLVESIGEHDSKRFKSECVALKSMTGHVEACVNEKQRADAKRELEKQRADKARELAVARELATRTCNICNRVFGSVHALNNHHDAVHCFECEYCYKVFNNEHSLHQHCDATGHW